MATTPKSRVLEIFMGKQLFVKNTLAPNNPATKHDLYLCVVQQVQWMPVAKRASARATLDGAPLYPLV